MHISFEKEPARVQVSMRLPADVASKIDAFASRKEIRKTDAYLYFLRLGLAAEEDAHNGQSSTSMQEQVSLSSLNAKLDRLLALLSQPQIIPPEDTKIDNGPSLHQADERASIIEAVRQTSEFFPAIRRAYLFGSVARGTHSNESDIDIRVEINPGETFNLHDLVHYAKYIEQQTGREVDVVSARTIRNAALSQAIEREKVLVYDREEH